MDDKESIKVCSEPDESRVPVFFRFGLLLGQLCGVVPPLLPRSLVRPLRTS